VSESPSPASSGKPLQFETAEFASGQALAAELSCTACRQPLVHGYYEANGQKVCLNCAEQLSAARSGSSIVAFFKAGIFGLLAGVAGCLIYYGVRAATGYEVGLIAIAVGLMVGAAVRAGSGHRGGWIYQIMAMLITYGSIVTSYVPSIVSELQSSDDENLRKIPTAVAAVIAWFFAWFAPFLSLPQNLIGVLIIAFGVYEAWKINKRQDVTVVGPFALNTTTASSLSAQPALPNTPTS
jgi:hypothetical protein